MTAGEGVPISCPSGPKMPDTLENQDAFPEPSIPAVHALHLAEVVARFDVTKAHLFADLDLSEENLADPNGRLSIGMVERLVERARILTGEPGLGFHVGLQMRISAHGALGFAAMTSGTVREALEVITRFAPTRTNALAVHSQVDGAVASLVLEERASLGTARDVIVFALLTGIAQLAHALTGQKLAGSMDVAFAEPDYFQRFEPMIPGVMRFSQPSHRLVFDASILDLPLAMHDPAARNLAREQCERELDALGRQGQLVSRVRALLPRADGGFRSLDEIARAIHVSSRTLKRQLAARGTSYSDLLEEQRRERATLLVRRGELTVDEVARRLGYSDSANFIRAFRRWTGMTPKAFRGSST